MREIKFRAIATQDYETSTDGIQCGDWVYGYYYFCRRRESGIIVTELQAECGGVGSGLVQVEIEVDHKTAGQAIGLEAKNGKEIYEGDIIKTRYDVVKVVYFGTSFCLAFGGNESGTPIFPYNVTNSLRIIGNIHENPELLKG